MDVVHEKGDGFAMKIHSLPGGDSVHRYKKSIVVTFTGERHVISTGPNNGGYHEDLQAVFNNDSNPGAGMACIMRGATYEEHMNQIAIDDLGLDPSLCTGLCTAASMENVSIKSLSFEDLTVTALVTGGIEHNAGRAGDDATFCEKSGVFYPIEPGTINIILHINANLDSGTLARSLVTCTEAKVVAISELLAPSRYSNGIATGSGTDGTIVICNPSSSLKLTNAGKNSKLGELIGKTVITAVKEALKKQSDLSPEYQHDILHRMDRFGITEDSLWTLYRKDTQQGSYLSRAEFMDRLDRIKKEPVLVTLTSLYAHLLDQLKWGLLSEDEVIPACAHLLKQMYADYNGDTSSLHKASADLQQLIHNLCHDYARVVLHEILK